MFVRRTVKNCVILLAAVTVFVVGLHFTVIDNYSRKTIRKTTLYRNTLWSVVSSERDGTYSRSHQTTKLAVIQRPSRSSSSPSPSSAPTELSIEDRETLSKFFKGNALEMKPTAPPNAKHQPNTLHIKSNNFIIHHGPIVEVKNDGYLHRSNSHLSGGTERHSDSSSNNENQNMAIEKLPYIPYDISKARIATMTDSVPLNDTFLRKDIHHPTYPIILANKKLCNLPKNRRPFLLILMPTVHSNTKTREVIRNTWAKAAYNGGDFAGENLNETVRLLFLLGGSSFSKQLIQRLRKENDEHGDILVADFVDSYRNLSVKIATGVQWASRYCDGVGNLLKVDEDTYVNLPQLIRAIKLADKRSLSKKFVMGRPHQKYAPGVLRKGRWAVGPEYPLNHYPRYVYGHSYVISGHAIKPMLETLNKVPIVANEDAFFTGILAKLSNITRFQHKSFARPYYRNVICNITRGYYISVTGCCDDHLRKLYNDAVHKTCDSRKLSSYPVCDCRFYKRLSDYLHEKNMCRNNASIA